MEITIDGNELVEDMAVESMSKRTISKIAKLKAELKVQKEMYKNRFDNDDAWREADKAFREAKAKRGIEKLRILEDVGMKALEDKIAELQTTIKNEQLALSDWLYTYHKKTNATVLESDDGVMYLINRKFSVRKESKAARWLRLQAEKRSLQPLPGIGAGAVA